MSFTPFILGSGYTAWSALGRNRERQMQVLTNSAEQQRDEAYFRQKIGGVSSAADLVADRRLLKVALGAFGLEGDIANRAFIRRVLEDGTLKPGALSSKLADKRYAELSRAFGFDLAVPRTKISDFADRLLPDYRARRFEQAVGEVNPTLRLALTAERDLPKIASDRGSANTKWFRILGNAPLRSFVETAFGLPKAFGAINLDQQVTAVRAKAERMLGSDDPSALADKATLDKMIRMYVIRDNQQNNAPARGQLALQLLSPP
ncbi:DUF1217 domain-containing protein [Paracoccus sp. p3-h83]|uniref:DUF1217 domain-containing protein n=1 Tax=Paracoccus sp. p3-h83 TaxID=3342805 RepID=UPI0035B6DB03